MTNAVWWRQLTSHLKIVPGSYFSLKQDGVLINNQIIQYYVYDQILPTSVYKMYSKELGRICL